MPVRVQMGKLPSGDYGLRVVSGDGSTVIIDGTSNMHKIVATGTLSGTATTGSDQTVASITLSGLGTLSEILAHQAYYAVVDGSVDDPRVLGISPQWTLKYAATSSGGSPNSEFLAAVVYARIRGLLTGDPTGEMQLQLRIDNHAGGDRTVYSRYYVFQETAV